MESSLRVRRSNSSLSPFFFSPSQLTLGNRNVGITGVTLAIIRKDLLMTTPPKSFLDDIHFPS